MSNGLKIIITSDGSHSLINVELNETYHSIHGAIQESAYVFIKNGLEYFIELHKPQQISILEIGFGTIRNKNSSLLHSLFYLLQHIHLPHIRLFGGSECIKIN